MENINIQRARELLYSSPLLKYVTKEQIEQELKNIYIYQTEEEFNIACGFKELMAGGKFYAFNRNGQNHFNPKYVTPHKIIHEVLHGLSKKYDEQKK